MFIQAIIVIAVVSVIWALWSLRGLSANREMEETKGKLKKGRVIYQRTSSSSS